RPRPPRAPAGPHGPGPRPARPGCAAGPGRCLAWRSSGQQGVQLAGPLERVQVVEAADVGSADEDLRKGRAARALHHLALLLHVHGGDDLGVVHALVAQQGLGARAIGTERLGVDDDLGQGDSSNPADAPHLGISRAARTRAMTARSTARAPAAISADAQASAVAPVVNTSSTRRMRRPRTLRRPASVTVKAARTLRRRPRALLPPWLAVARDRTSASGTNSSPAVRASGRAVSAAWLNRRDSSRRRCRGTGATASASASRSAAARPIQRANRPANS